MDNSTLLPTACISSLIVLSIAAWSVWTRRFTLGSRFDCGTTLAVALLGMGTVLNAPWDAIQLPLAGGRCYVLMLIGQLSYLAGAVAAIASVYVRILSDDAFRPFMLRIGAAASGAAVIMVVAFLASSVPLNCSVIHPYLALPDTALVVYWYAAMGTAALLAAVLGYGILVLCHDPRTVMGSLMLVSTLIACIGGCALSVVVGVFTGWTQVLSTPAWFGGQLGSAGYAISAAIQWRRRVQQFGPSPLSKYFS